MNKPFRVCLFIGLILNVLLFTYMTISIIIGLVSAIDLVTNPDSLGEAFAAIAVVITIMLMIILIKIHIKIIIMGGVYSCLMIV